MRNAPVPGRKKLTVAKINAKLSLDSPELQKTTAHELTLIPPLHTLPRKTTMRLLHDQNALYIRADAELGDEVKFATFKRDHALANREAFDVYLAPNSTTQRTYRFTAGANAASRYDALNRQIADVLDPRYGKEDPSWNGDWTTETRVDVSHKRWHILITIPFQTLGVEPSALALPGEPILAATTRSPAKRSIEPSGRPL